MNIYEALTSEQPVYVEGKDFFGLNYGKNYSSKFNGDSRKIILTDNHVSYVSMTKEGIFPKTWELQKKAQLIPLREATHVGDCKDFITDLSLEEVISELKGVGVNIR